MVVKTKIKSSNLGLNFIFQRLNSKLFKMFLIQFKLTAFSNSYVGTAKISSNRFEIYRL